MSTKNNKNEHFPTSMEFIRSNARVHFRTTHYLTNLESIKANLNKVPNYTSATKHIIV